MGPLRLSGLPWQLSAAFALVAAVVVVTRLARGDATPGWGLVALAVLSGVTAWRGWSAARSRRRGSAGSRR